MGLLGLFRFFLFLLPFMKEIFLGKETSKDDKEKVSTFANELSKSQFIRKTLITIGCVSLVLNMYLIKQTIILSQDVIAIRKKIKEQEGLITHPLPEIRDRPIHLPQPGGAASSVPIKPLKQIKTEKPESLKKEISDGKIQSSGEIEKSEYDKIRQINEIK